MRQFFSGQPVTFVDLPQQTPLNPLGYVNPNDLAMEKSGLPTALQADPNARYQMQVERAMQSRDPLYAVGAQIGAALSPMTGGADPFGAVAKVNENYQNAVGNNIKGNLAYENAEATRRQQVFQGLLRQMGMDKNMAQMISAVPSSAGFISEDNQNEIAGAGLGLRNKAIDQQGKYQQGMLDIQGRRLDLLGQNTQLDAYAKAVKNRRDDEKWEWEKGKDVAEAKTAFELFSESPGDPRRLKAYVTAVDQMAQEAPNEVQKLQIYREGYEAITLQAQSLMASNDPKDVVLGKALFDKAQKLIKNNPLLAAELEKQSAPSPVEEWYGSRESLLGVPVPWKERTPPMPWNVLPTLGGLAIDGIKNFFTGK